MYNRDYIVKQGITGTFVSGNVGQTELFQKIWLLSKFDINKAGYTAIRCVLAGTDSSFGQKRHFCMISTRV